MLGSAQPVLNADQIPLRTGPPTKEEILVHYPPKFSWNQLKTFVNSGFVLLHLLFANTIETCQVQGSRPLEA